MSRMKKSMESKLDAGQDAEPMPFEVVHKLVMDGKVQALEILARRGLLKWGHITAPNYLVEAIAWKDVLEHGGRERAAGEALMRAALESARSGGGGGDFFRTLSMEDGKGTTFVSPIKDLIRHDWAGALALYLEAGFNPTVKHGWPARTAIEYAQRLDMHDLAAMMQAHVARTAAEDALRDTPSPTPATRVKP